ncbi:MAG: phage terminase large subunit [Clostridia bacterium]|nr:phage terminase large subunit [Clostridia bacterium]
MPIPYAPLTFSQRAYIEKTASAWLNVLEGGKRAGKNIVNLLAWATCLETHPDKIHLAAGVSLGTAKMNLLDSNGFGLKYLFEGRCRSGKYMDKEALYLNTKAGEKIIIFAGGGKSDAAAAIKGNSYGTAYITEVNECHQTFVQEVFDRTLASSDRKIFLDLNPKPPRHWFYREILDPQMERWKKGENPGFNYAHFNIFSNQSLSNEKIRELLATYDPHSVWFRSDILGERTSSSGRIYTTWDPEHMLLSPEELQKIRPVQAAVGVDVGGTDATVATLAGLTQGNQDVVLLDGMYHKQGISDKMDEAAYAALVAAWLKPWADRLRMPGSVYVDSANKLFRRALEKAMMDTGIRAWAIRPFDKKDGINERIAWTTTMMHQGRWKVARHLIKWQEAYDMATWDTKEFEKGEWVRLDDGSYPVDCLDSAEYATYGYRRFTDRG